MGGQETLRLPWRLEPAHKLLSFPRRSVRALDPVIDPFVGAVVGDRGQLTDRFDIAAQLVRDDNAVLVKTGDQLFQKPLDRTSMSRTYPRPSTARHNVPLICCSGPVALDAMCEMPTKPVHPFANGFPAESVSDI